VPAFDRKKFNEDPKHDEARGNFDAMVEDALHRIAAKKKKDNPPEDKGAVGEFLDGMGIGNLFGESK
jgi:hypothetical protein